MVWKTFKISYIRNKKGEIVDLKAVENIMDIGCKIINIKPQGGEGVKVERKVDVIQFFQ